MAEVKLKVDAGVVNARKSKEYAQESEAWAVGKKDGVDVPNTADQYHNNSKYYKEQADASATAAASSESDAEQDALKSEGYAVGKQNGTDVSSGTYYHNNSKYFAIEAYNHAADADNAKIDAVNAKNAAASSKLDSEAYAVGKRNGSDVTSGDPAYHNNAKYYKDQSASYASDAHSDANYASGYANQASASATTASGHANAASGSAGNAAAAAAAAASSATAAAASASAIAATYDSTKTYAVGEYCLYNGGMYVCTTAITTAEAWTAAHWSAVKVGTELTALKEDLTKTNDSIINSFQNEYPLLLNAKSNTYIDKTDGTEKPSQSGSVASDYMPCKGDGFLRTVSTQYVSYNSFYDASKNFISAFDIPTGDGIVKLPDNACYFRVSTTASVFDTIKIASGRNVNDEITNIENSIINSFQNEFPLLLNAKPNTYIDNTDGTEKPSQSGYVATDCMPCKSGKYLKTTVAEILTNNAFYNANKEFISNFIIIRGNGVVMVPDGACYFRVSAESNVFNTLKIRSVEISEFEKFRIHCERGIISTTVNRYGGDVHQFGQYWKSYIVNKYPIVISKSEPIIYIPPINTSNQNYSIYYRDDTGALIGDRVQKPCSEASLLSPPATAMYFDIMVPSEEVIDIVFYATNKHNSVYESKRFDYNNAAESKCFFEIDYNKGLYTGLCYMLPPNYTHNGGKVPMVIWFDGNGNYNSMNDNFSQAKKPGLDYVRDEGFAVMQVYSWGNYYQSKEVSENPIGWDQPYPVPTCLDCIKKAIEYMVDRYNIDPNDVHIMSKSMGGIISTYFVNRPIWNFRSIGMFSPAMDVLALNGRDPSSRMAIAEELGFVGNNLSDFYDISIDRTKPEEGGANFYYSPRCQHVWLDNMGGLARINPIWLDIIDTTLSEKYATSLSDAQAWHTDSTDENIYTHPEYKKCGIIPVKIWAATQDVDVPYRAIVQTVSNWRNSGHQAEIRTANGDHSYFDVDSDAIEVTTILGITHNVTCGWIENVEWIRSNSSHPAIEQV